MPAEFGSGGKGLDLPLGRYVAQIMSVETVQGTDFKDRTRKVNQFKFGVNVWLAAAQRWEGRTLYMTQRISDLAVTKDPQYVSKLTRLIRACGQPIPQSEPEARAWDERSLVGRQFGLYIEGNPEADTAPPTIRFVPLKGQQAQPGARGAGEAVRSQQSAAPTVAPALAPAPTATDPLRVPQTYQQPAAPPPPAPTPAAPMGIPEGDPFAEDEGANPARVAAVTGDEDLWR